MTDPVGHFRLSLVARSIPKQRFPQLVAAAVRVLVENGFRQTQMEAVARSLGVAKGTIYRYVASKHALLDAVIRYADGHTPWPDVAALPLPTPEPGATAAYLSQRIAAEVAEMERERQRACQEDGGPRAELAAVIGSLYRCVHRNRHGIKVADRCAREFPELAAIWFEKARFGQVGELVRRLCEPVGPARASVQVDPAIAARTVVETIMFWACDRHWDPAPQTVDESAVESSVIALCVNALM